MDTLVYIFIGISALMGFKEVGRLRDKETKKYNVKAFLILAGCIIIFVLGIIIKFSDDTKEEYSNDYGVIKAPETKNMLRAISFGPKGSGPTFTSQGDFYYMEEIGLKIEIIDGKMYAGFTLRDEEGKVIGKMENNEWQISPNNSFDKNFDASAIEIKDAKDRIVMNTEFYDGVLYIHGIFPIDDQGNIMVLLPTKDGGSIQQTTDRKSLKEYPKIAPIFKYPSFLHRGERVTN